MANQRLNDGAIWHDEHLFVSESIVERDGQQVRLLADEFHPSATRVDLVHSCQFADSSELAWHDGRCVLGGLEKEEW